MNGLAGTVTGAILAGGPNTGMDGRSKALLPFGNEPLVQRQIQAMQEICREVVVVTNDPKPFFRILDHSVRIITDSYSGSGPMSGVHAALRLARNPFVWIVGSDMPFISAEAAARLVMAGRFGNHFDAVLPVLGGKPVPLHGVYDTRCADKVQSTLEEGRGELTDLMGAIRWYGLPADSWERASEREGLAGSFAYSFDDQIEYERALELAFGSLKE
ncbi:molybdenum cofactor guanylyltransferase [Cohnella faecalis]|uniref:Molybdenum cofactor guanylyltransferase n=1 Tax=Cohnella faecalis TaxID=2315694 RepID=A0A398CWN7_9BACL|nr:molybdenum cofactor guanylyltransferase [Cohnella faecalis]RIE03434.1 molybdenum cofactor guanylyltransferase [Cohnella faecalis]